MKADLILHPVRMRILSALAGGRQLTTQGIAGALPDIPQATLYRHLSKLVENGLIEVVGTQQIRGATEKTYSLPEGKSYVLTADEVKHIGKEEHVRHFATFLVNMLRDFESYIHSKKEPDFLKDGVGYRQIPLWLTDEEFQEMTVRLREVLADYARLPEEPGRKRRMFATIVMPTVEEKPIE